MSFYQSIAQVGTKFISKSALFKYGFNLSPMYSRSTARIVSVAKDLRNITVKLPISWKNRNYANSIFGGSMFSAVDPIPMVQLINLLGHKYIVWDKSASIEFKRPAKEDLYAEFSYSKEELEEIVEEVTHNKEIEIKKVTQLKNKLGDKVYCEVQKIIYVADKNFFKEKKKKHAIVNKAHTAK